MDNVAKPQPLQMPDSPVKTGFPAPSKTKKDDVIIQLPISISAKILLLNTMVSGNIRPVDLAQKMGIKPQEVNRIIDTGHTTKIF